MLILIILILLIVLLSVIIWKYTEKKEFRLKKDKLDKKIEYLKNINQNIPKTNKIIYPVLYVNLDRSTERNEKILDQFKKYNIKNFTRIQGIDGNALHSIYEGTQNGFSFTNNYNITKPELGCTLSHLKAIKYAGDNNLDIALIIEDDLSLELMPLWKETLPELIDGIKEDWDVIKIHNMTNNDGNWGNKAYIIKKSFIDKMLKCTFKDGKFVLDRNNKLQKQQKREGIADVLIYSCSTIMKILEPSLFYLISNRKSTIHPKDDLGKIGHSIETIEQHIKKLYLKSM